MQVGNKWKTAASCFICLAASIGCGGSGSKTPKAETKSTAAPESPRKDPGTSNDGTKPPTTSPSDQAGTTIEGPTGTIKGTIRFVGEVIPTSTIVSNTTDPTICGEEISKRDVEISPENRGIRNVVAWLEDVKLPEGYKPPRQDVVIDNKNCQFEPHAAAITVGSTVEATNSDVVFHTTNLYGAANENMPLVSKGSSQKTVVRRAGIIQVKCDKHGWMQAFIRVDPHPFHAVTDANGEFSIANVPVGTYKLKILHEVFYDQTVEVTVKADETSSLEFSFPTPEPK